jgi:cupin 2 domain-containing protein
LSAVKAVNLLYGLPARRQDELFETLLLQPGFHLERILSWGQVTPDGEWYDQAQDEWVLLLGGAARLLVEGQKELALRPGDAVLLPAHHRHRVVWTDPEQTTVWLALHYKTES